MGDPLRHGGVSPKPEGSDPAPSDPGEALSQLRRTIDRIDSDMHQLLMDRGRVIENLIAVKTRQGGGSAFRPGREADMMAKIAARHEGLLPLDTVEGIWRIIISTFTYVQAHYQLHVDVCAGDAAMRDSARFHFGFTVPFVPHHGPQAVISAVAKSQGDLGLVRAVGSLGDGAWHRALIGERAPKIIARTPFVDRPNHPAGLPTYVISLPLAEAAAVEIELFSIQLPRWRENLPLVFAEEGGQVVSGAADEFELSILAAFTGPKGFEPARRALEKCGFGDIVPHYVGSHAAPYRPGATTSSV